ncbi:MAG: hypothetical protein HY786_00600 [Deltaproteobacteria bacterium]|nr:hypothetical protein [Deltaproteobacteria bacterium]
MTAFEFSKDIIETCSRYDFIKGIDILLLDEPALKVRAVLNESIFIDVFYNAETCKYSFALIRDNKRIFGADNLRGWHIHPFENPDEHIDSDPVSLENFLNMIRANMEKGIFSVRGD